MFDHDGGSVPVRLLLYRANSCSCVMLDHDRGSVPVRLLLLRPNCCSCVMLDHDGGSVPVRLFCFVLIAQQHMPHVFSDRRGCG